MRKGIFQHCHLTVSENICQQDERFYDAITQLGFQFSGLIPLVIQKGSTTQQDIIKLTELLVSFYKPEDNGQDTGALAHRSAFSVSHLYQVEELCETSAEGKEGTEKGKLHAKPRSKINKAFCFGKINTGKIKQGSQNDLNSPGRHEDAHRSEVIESLEDKVEITGSMNENSATKTKQESLSDLNFARHQENAYYAEANLPLEDTAGEIRDCVNETNTTKTKLESQNYPSFPIHQENAYTTEVNEAFEDKPKEISDSVYESDTETPATTDLGAAMLRLFTLENDLSASEPENKISTQSAVDKIQNLFDTNGHGHMNDGSEVKDQTLMAARRLDDSQSRYMQSAVVATQRASYKYAGYPGIRSGQYLKHKIRNSVGNVEANGPPVFSGIHSRLKVQIYKADITKLQVDGIVNAANEKLRYGFGLAKAIANAAGRQLVVACENFIRTKRSLGVTNLFVSPGGHLPAKHVLHAVGPKWDAYGDKQKCIDDLRHTVLRCLLQAGNLGMTSIAFPSISAARFGVPEELCAHTYMEAVKQFDAFNAKEGRSSLHDIHFVDVDDIMVTCITDSFKMHWSEPVEVKDFDFCRQHLSYMGGAAVLYRPPNQLPQYIQLPKMTPAPSKKKAISEKNFCIGSIPVRISSKSALDFQADLIVTIGNVFDKLIKGHNLQAETNLKACDEYLSCEDYEFHRLNEPGDLSPLICELKPDPIVSDDMKIAFRNLSAAVGASSVFGSDTKIVLTSRVLYAEADNRDVLTSPKGSLKHQIDKEMVKRFAGYLVTYLNRASNGSSSSSTYIVTASADALPTLRESVFSYGCSRVYNPTPKDLLWRTWKQPQEEDYDSG